LPPAFHLASPGPCLNGDSNPWLLDSCKSCWLPACCTSPGPRVSAIYVRVRKCAANACLGLQSGLRYKKESPCEPYLQQTASYCSFSTLWSSTSAKPAIASHHKLPNFLNRRAYTKVCQRRTCRCSSCKLLNMRSRRTTSSCS
jgi:hypothetical protein